MRPLGPWSDSESISFKRYLHYKVIAKEGNNVYSVPPYPWVNISYNNYSRATTHYNSGPRVVAVNQRFRGSGWSEPRPYSMVRLNDITKDEPCDVEYSSAKKTNWSSYHRYHVEGRVSPPNSSDFDSHFGTSGIVNARYRANMKFIKNAHGTSFNSQTFTGEGRQAITGLLKTASDIVGRTQSYESKVVTRVQKLLHEWHLYKPSRRPNVIHLVDSIVDLASSRWLEWQYGIKPLHSDLISLGQTLAKIETGFVRDKVSAHRQDVFCKVTKEDLGYPYLGTVPGFRSIIRTRTCEYGIGALAVLTDRQRAANTATLLGFDASSVLPTLWEIIPYSFLVDYFTNVGDMITAYTTVLPQLTHSWGVSAVEDTLDWDDVVYTGQSSGNTYTGHGTQGSITSFRFLRLVDPVFMPQYQESSFDDLSFSKKLNVAAVGFQAMRGNMIMKAFLHGIGY